MFKQANVGKTDRIIRIVIGALLIVVPMLTGSGFNWITTIIGVVLIATAFTRFCPLYKVLGVNTCQNGSCEKK